MMTKKEAVRIRHSSSNNKVHEDTFVFVPGTSFGFNGSNCCNNNYIMQNLLPVSTLLRLPFLQALREPMAGNYDFVVLVSRNNKGWITLAS